MKLLLDTHIWVWTVAAPERLSATVRSSIESPANELWLSSISVWEVMVLVRKKRLEVSGGVDSWIAAALVHGPFREVPITHAIAMESERLDLPHRDPADRFIVASARALGAVLVTADEALITAKATAVLANDK